MSIINDALKKAGQSQEAQNNRPRPSDASRLGLAVETARKKQRVNWGPVFVILVLTMITGPLVAPLFSSPYRSTNSSFLVPSYRETLSSQQASSTRQAQFGIEETPRVPAAAAVGVLKPETPLSMGERANFVMNGIMYGSPDSYCLINGRVVKVGEKVNGATLVAVTPEKATLDYQGRKIDLWVAS